MEYGLSEPVYLIYGGTPAFFPLLRPRGRETYYLESLVIENVSSPAWHYVSPAFFINEAVFITRGENRKPATPYINTLEFRLKSPAVFGVYIHSGNAGDQYRFFLSGLLVTK